LVCGKANTDRMVSRIAIAVCPDIWNRCSEPYCTFVGISPSSWIIPGVDACVRGKYAASFDHHIMPINRCVGQVNCDDSRIGNWASCNRESCRARTQHNIVHTSRSWCDCKRCRRISTRDGDRAGRYSATSISDREGQG